MYSKELLDKVGNAVIYLANNIDNPSKTKILKLLYILDEFSIKKSGIPFFNLKYQVWKYGPVEPDFFADLSSCPTLLGPYIKKGLNKFEHEIILPNKEFCDDEFTANEVDMLEYVAKMFKQATTNQLKSYTHRENSPWYNTALKNNVLVLLESEQINTTPFEIDLTELIAHDTDKLSIYNEYLEYH